jgi:hypothetical protein
MSTASIGLLNEAEQLAKVADAIGRTYATELARVLRDMEGELRRLALEALTGSQTSLARAVRASRLRRQIQNALREAGYPQLSESATQQGLDRLLEQVEKLRGAAKLAQFTTTDHARLLALKEMARLDLVGQGEAISHALWRTLSQGLFSQRPIADVLDDLAEAIDVEVTEARTLYDTTVNVFARQVEAMKASGEPDEVFAYLGPIDAKTRPFCYERVGKVFTREQIDAWENGQLPNAFLTGGGYNCRHQPIALSKLSSLRKLVNTDQRMPEVQRRITEIEIGDRKAA